MKINEIKKIFDLPLRKIEIRGKSCIVDTGECKYVVKKNINHDIINYLNSRGFKYYPNIIEDSDYKLIEYIESINMPDEQKLLDLINLVALLHAKTTFFKEIDNDKYKKIYEDIANNIYYLNNYYDDLLKVIETKVFMSPSEYLLARNISFFYEALSFCERRLQEWYELIKTKEKVRQVVLHNNLSLEHILRNNNAYLISWDKSKIDIPIFDLYKLYRRCGRNYDFSEILHHYEKIYPLLKEERELFFILIALPPKLEFTSSVFDDCVVFNREIELMFKTAKLISPYYTNNTKEPQNQKEKN